MRGSTATILLTTISIAGSATAAVHEVVIPANQNAFVPATVNIAVGDTVRWIRMAGYHQVAADDGSFTGPLPGAWGTYERVFSSAGSVPYYCTQHADPGGNTMNGVVNVTGGGGGGGAGTLLFSGSANRSVGEGAGNLTVTVQRTGGDDGAVSVQYETVNNGSANTPVDYIQTNGTLNWGNNDDDNKTFVVPIVNDGETEGNETFSIQLISPGGGATLGSPNVVTVTINDNDSDPGSPGTIRFTSASADTSVGESDGSVTLSAERVGGAAGAVSVTVATADGTAVAGADYTAGNAVLSWADGNSSNRTFVIPIADDAVEEGSESFTATLSAPTGGAVLGSPSTATVTVQDDDFSCEPCVPDATTLCLAGGSGDPSRFRVRVTWTDFEDDSGPGMAVPFTDDSGFFYFFQEENLELLVKMVNTCGSVFDSFWFYYAAASNVGLDYQVVDTTACVAKTYSNPRGNFASFGDIAAFSTCSATAAAPLASAPAPAPAPAPMRRAAASPIAAERHARTAAPLAGEGGACTPCVADATTLCLAGGSGDPNRFQVRVTWTDFADVSGPGMAVPFTDDSGFFYFFDPDNLELLVKMVNTCGSPFDSYWFYYAAASNVGLEYEVIDTTACVTRTYSNPRGTFASFGDIHAFDTCSATAVAE